MIKGNLKKILKNVLPEELYSILYKTYSNSFWGRDPLISAYKKIGILNYQNIYASGEYYFLRNILPNYIKDRNPVFLDVGANTGQYSLALRSLFPNSIIYAIEPNTFAYSELINFGLGEKFKCFNIGLGAKEKEANLFISKANKNGEHSTIYKDVFIDMHNKDEGDLAEISIFIKTLDEFCIENGIGKIDFLKIDTEGYEYQVLCGGKSFLNAGKIKIIQFEFNEMNIISRVFMRDFYNLLENYSIYRLLPKGLLPLHNYSSSYEIFKYQNIIAINKAFSGEYL